jgi:hypothetical protein
MTLEIRVNVVMTLYVMLTYTIARMRYDVKYMLTITIARYRHDG